MAFCLFRRPGMPNQNNQEAVYTTPWFELIAKRVEGDSAPYYALHMADYVVVVAVTNDGDYVLVRQHRPAVDHITLEFPAGVVEPGESPGDAASRELREETGFTAQEVTLLGDLAPDTGRLANRMWCFLASGFSRESAAETTESQIETVIHSPAELSRCLADGRFESALHIAALFLATFQGHIAIHNVTWNKR